MAHELDGMKQKALAFSLITKDADVKKHIGELEAGYKEYDRKKDAFQDQLGKLRTLIGEKE